MAKQKPRRRKNQREQSEFKEVVLKIDRVNRVVKGGRRLRFRATVAIGNEKGLVGMGVGKSEEVAQAVRKGVTKAKKALQKVQIIEGTIAHQAKAKFKGSEVIILPARQGTGVIAGGSLRVIAELAGIKNLLSKSHGSNNRLNSAKAALRALASLKVVAEAPKVEESKDQKTNKSDEQKNKGTKEQENKKTEEAKKEEPVKTQDLASPKDKKEEPKKKAPKKAEKTDTKAEAAPKSK